jgi:thiol-disulfide isomerase/thioredoxin
MRDARVLLGRAGRKVALVAVNVDLRKTGVAAVARFTRAEGLWGRWAFLTGPPASLRRVLRAYGIYSQEIDGVDQHTAAVYLIRPDGREARVYLISSGPGNVPDQAWVIARAASVYLGDAPVLPIRDVAGERGGPVYLAAPTAFRLPRETGHGPSGTVSVHPGEGPTLVDFFATWCHDCQEEMQSLAAARRAVRSVRIVAVDLRIAEPSGAPVRTLVGRDHLPFPVGLDTTGQVSDRYGVTALPSLVLISSAGRIVWRHTGYLSAAGLTRALRSAASQP